MKEHEIKTVQDMLSCINEENIDRFLTDLKNVLLSAKNISNALEVSNLLKDGYTWIDDGENNLTINVHEVN